MRRQDNGSARKMLELSPTQRQRKDRHLIHSREHVSIGE